MFRVVTRKLVEQARRGEGERENGRVGGGAEEEEGGRGEEYFERVGARGGSFRVGRDRMSWLGFPSGLTGIEAGIEEVVAESANPARVAKGRGRKCC